MPAKPTISKKSSTKYRQGRYMVRNPQKYKGNPGNITYRSSWEYELMKWCDLNPAVLHWGSEEVVVPYVSPVDNKFHRYFVDFYAEIMTRNGVERYLIEIKPYAQTVAPKPKKRNGLLTESYKEEIKTYMVNRAKWKAAASVAMRSGMCFIVLTEKELFGGLKR